MVSLGQAKSQGRTLIGPVRSAVVTVGSYKKQGGSHWPAEKRICTKKNLEIQDNHYIKDSLTVEQLISGRLRIMN